MLYAYKCPGCANKEERFIPVEDRNKQECEICGNILDIVISPTASIWVTSCPTASKGKQTK